MKAKRIALLLLAAAAACAQAQILSLRIADEFIPAGGIAQLKLEVTEPKPISTGGLRFAVDWAVEGVAMFSPAGDVSAVAVIRGGKLTLRFLSPSGTLGLAPNGDYPILTVAVRVPEGLPRGAQTQFALDAVTARTLFAGYSVETKPGRVTVADGPSIDNVLDGSSVKQPGDLVTILGKNFVPGTRVDLDGVKAALTIESPERLTEKLEQRADLHGLRIRARHPNGTQVTYYSYGRTIPDGASAHPLLAAAYPVFPRQGARQCLLVAVGAPGEFGLAIENRNAADTKVTIEALDWLGQVRGATSLPLAANHRIVRSAAEFVPAPGRLYRVRADLPVQVLGMLPQDADGSVLPIPPLVIVR